MANLGRPIAVVATDANGDPLVSGLGEHVTVDASALPSGAATETTSASMAALLTTLAGAISSGSMKAVLQAGTAAFGKLAANAGVNIGEVSVSSLPSLILSAGAAVIGHVILDASSAVIGHVIVDSSGLPTGAATAAKQPALGVAGTPSADVQSFQGVAGGVAAPVSLATAPALVASSAMIGNVTPQPLSAVVTTSTTVTTAGTRVTCASGTFTQGFYFVNNHATAIAYIGLIGTVSSTAYYFAIPAGQRSDWLPFTNTNLFGADSSVSGHVILAVGG